MNVYWKHDIEKACKALIAGVDEVRNEAADRIVKRVGLTRRKYWLFGPRITVRTREQALDSVSSLRDSDKQTAVFWCGRIYDRANAILAACKHSQGTTIELSIEDVDMLDPYMGGATNGPALSREELVNAMAKSAHNSWWQTYIDLGYTSRKAAWGEEFMVTFEELSERGKEFDRMIMRAILKTFSEKGITLQFPPQ